MNIYFASFVGKNSEGQRKFGNLAVKKATYPSIDQITQKAEEAAGLNEILVLSVHKFENDQDYFDFIGSQGDKMKLVGDI